MQHSKEEDLDSVADYLRTGSKYLAILMAALVCLGIGVLFGHLQPLEYLTAQGYQMMGGAMLASFTIFFAGMLAAKNLDSAQKLK